MNKNTLLFLAVAMLSFANSAYAQLEKGNFLIGGSISLSSSSSSYTPPLGATYPGDRKVFSFSFNPSISYMVLKRLSVGAIVPYHYQKWWNGSPARTYTDYSLGLRTRYYFPFKQWAVFPEISYASGKSISGVEVMDAGTSQSHVEKLTGTTRSGKLGIGITYFANKNIGIEGILYSQTTSLSFKDVTSPNNSFTDYVNFDIGVQIYLNR